VNAGLPIVLRCPRLFLRQKRCSRLPVEFIPTRITTRPLRFPVPSPQHPIEPPRLRACAETSPTLPPPQPLGFTEKNPAVYRLEPPTHRGGGTCKALACIGRCCVLWTGDRYSVVLIWFSGNTGSNVVALWLTLLSDDGSRGRFGDGGVSVAMSVGPEAKGAARVCGRLPAPC